MGKGGKKNSGIYFVNAAEKAGFEVTYPNGGDHVKVEAPAGRGYIIIPLKREVADGTRCHIRKFFKALGVIVCIPFVIGIINALTP
jgi:hypothetical protein